MVSLSLATLIIAWEHLIDSRVKGPVKAGRIINSKDDVKIKFKIDNFCYYMKSPKLPVGPVGKFRLLGGAAPLSS